MRRVLDLLECALIGITANSSNILDKPFMMSIFSIGNEIPLFAEYINHVYEKKRTTLVGDEHNKVVRFDFLQAELFFPKMLAVKLGKLSIETMLKELQVTSNATAKHLSSAGTKLSWLEPSSESNMVGKDSVADKLAYNLLLSEQHLGVWDLHCRDLSSA